MRIVLQRVKEASVRVEGATIGSIATGYLILLCVMEGDTAKEAETLAEKICNLRLFDGSDGKINDRSIQDVGGSALVVSQFTLAGRLEKGNRPDYTRAADPAEAKKLYEYFVQKLRDAGCAVETGSFGAHMEVALVNDGPVTLLLERGDHV